MGKIFYDKRRKGLSDDKSNLFVPIYESWANYFGHAYLNFSVSNLEIVTTISNSSKERCLSAEISGTANLNTNHEISLFGIDKKIHVFEIRIIKFSEVNNLKQKPTKDFFSMHVSEPYSFIDDDNNEKYENLSGEVEFFVAIHEKSFKRMVHYIENGLIKEFYFTPEVQNIKGLYLSFSEYKILLEKESVTNHEDLPETFYTIDRGSMIEDFSIKFKTTH